MRTTKTASGKTAVQVVKRHRQQTKIIKHLGSAGNDSTLADLVSLANQYALSASPDQPLFPEIFAPTHSNLVSLNHLRVLDSYRHGFAYEFLSYFYHQQGFAQLANPVLADLVKIRIIEPASKIRSLELLQTYFGITYGHSTLYRNLKDITNRKAEIENVAVTYAKAHFAFDFSLVFYDVTTLYFETFSEDKEKFRQPGFSKDHKNGQPQILIGLVVTREGYPITSQTFSGKTFEGKTILPVILGLKEKYHIDKLTVVADAGMLSLRNIEELTAHRLRYIVGARIGSLPDDLVTELSTFLNRTENKFFETLTPRGRLIADYSKKRAAKDKSDRDRQIRKAEWQISQGDPVLQRFRFLKAVTKAHLSLNTDLITKDALQDGLKGYYTNVTNLGNELIVARYKDLWRVEQAFRIAKSDLEARPMFHRRQETIEAHVLIVFVSLCLIKLIETQTQMSIQKVKDEIWKVLDLTMEDALTGQRFNKRMETKTNPLASYVDKFKEITSNTY